MADISKINVNGVEYSIKDATVPGQIATALASVLTFKGTKNSYDQLPGTGNKVGDVWEVDGSQYAWDGTEWQELGSVVDLSGYVTTVTGATANDIAVLTADGKLSDSNKKFGDAAFASTADPAKVPTQKSVRDFVKANYNKCTFTVSGDMLTITSTTKD